MEHSIVIAASLIGAGLIICGGAIGAALGNGTMTGKAIEGMARQPEAKGTILVNMFISIALVESFPIIGLVFAIIMMFANPFMQ